MSKQKLDAHCRDMTWMWLVPGVPSSIPLIKPRAECSCIECTAHQGVSTRVSKMDNKYKRRLEGRLFFSLAGAVSNTTTERATLTMEAVQKRHHASMKWRWMRSEAWACHRLSAPTHSHLTSWQLPSVRDEDEVPVWNQSWRPQSRGGTADHGEPSDLPLAFCVWVKHHAASCRSPVFSLC